MCILKKKFTLMELLLVIAIFAILLSMLLPSLTKARERARTAVCLSNMKQLNIGTQLYIQQNDGFIIRGRWDSNPKKSKEGTRWMIRLASLYDLDDGNFSGNEYRYGDVSVLVCPSDSISIKRRKVRDSTMQGTSYFGNGRIMNSYDPGNGWSEKHVAKFDNPSERLISTEKWGYWYGSMDRGVTQGHWNTSKFYTHSAKVDGTWTSKSLFGTQHLSKWINTLRLDMSASSWVYSRMYKSAAGHNSNSKPNNNPDWIYWRGPDQ